MPILAEATESAIQTAMGTALSGIQSDALSMIAKVMPYGLAIVGATLVITIGMKVFKQIKGK